MAADHTPGEPPSAGSTIFVNIGCRPNSSSAETKAAAAKRRCGATDSGQEEAAPAARSSAIDMREAPERNAGLANRA